MRHDNESCYSMLNKHTVENAQVMKVISVDANIIVKSIGIAMIAQRQTTKGIGIDQPREYPWRLPMSRCRHH